MKSKGLGDDIAKISKANGNSLKSIEERDMIYTIYNSVNKTNDQPTSCSSCLNRVVENLRSKYNEY